MKQQIKTTCKNCGSENVEIRAWINQSNGNISVETGEDNDTYCNSCEQHAGVNVEVIEPKKPKKNKKNYYRTVIEIEVLSEEPYGDGKSLDDINYDITEGHCSGVLKTTVSDEKLNGKQMADKLEEQGSDTEFFNLDKDGEEVE